MALPTPSQAAAQRSTAGFFPRVGSTFLRNAPYFSPFYNLLNSAVHAGQGTLGQWGPAPTSSVIGKLFQRLSSNPTGAPLAQPAAPVGPVAAPTAPAVAPTPPPAGAGGLSSLFRNAYPSSFGSFDTTGEIYAGGPVAGFDSINGRTVYNARGVVPRAPAPSSLQAFGPGGLNSFSRTIIPYNPDSGPEGGSNYSKGIPGGAQAFMNWVRANNIA